MDNKPIRTLLIEDNPGDARLIREMLTEIGVKDFDLKWVDGLSKGLEYLSAEGVDIILLDLSLPDSQGLETFTSLYAQASRVPIIILSGLADEELAIKAVHEGAQDYLVKGQVDGNLLVRAIHYAIERKKAEEKIKEQNKFLTDVIESLSHPFYVIDANDYTIKLCNSAAQSGNLLKNITCHALTHKSSTPCQGKEHLCPLEVVKRTKKPVRVEHIHYDQDGNARNVEVHGHPIFDDNGNVIQMIGYGLDITERKKTEQALQEAYQKLKETQQQLIQSSKMVAMGQLAAGVSHELNQPLTGIKGFTQALLMDLEKNNPLRGDLNKIIEQTNRMDKIIQHVRFFARKSEFRMKELDVNQPIEDSLMLLKQQLKVHNIQLNTSLGRNLPKIQGDHNQLEQAFINLITNARDAIDSLKNPNGGEIMVESVLSSKDKKHIEITFQDTGCGISKENLGNIFNPFYTTKSPDGGIGLGLSIVYRIIENHKGRIEVKSQEGKGATFKIILPSVNTDSHR